MAQTMRRKRFQTEAANRELEYLATRDPLTGLINRRGLESCMLRQWRQGLRTRTPIALIMVDVDHFKAYNDSLGHPQGDVCLTSIAGVLGEMVRRPGDCAGRYGGEEFILLLAGTPLTSAGAMAEQLREKVSALRLPHPASPGGIVTVSLGVACMIPRPFVNMGDLLDLADAALYQAKREGRNRVSIAEADA